MALTQTATHAGPSWDEEVVPALRKRLESESRTLARRISAISLSSVEDADIIDTSNVPTPRRVPTRGDSGSSSGYQAQVSTPASNLNYTSSTSRGHAPRANGAHTPTHTHHATPSSSSTTPKQPARPRTYSQPFTSDNVPGRTRTGPNTPGIKPTRIPVASRPTNASSASLIYHPPPASSPPPPLPTDYHYPTKTHPVPRSSSFGLMNEPPPFDPSSLSSASTSHSNSNYIPAEQLPRSSTDSEERPFEHWYRGDTSRNGGVGELRVGKRQEMLDIANYGHRKALGANRPDVYEHRFRRKRADSIAGFTKKERERGSVYLDEERAREVGGLVMDEGPLTDLESEGGRGSVDTFYSARGKESVQGHELQERDYGHEQEGEEEEEGRGDVFDPLPAEILDSYHANQRSPTPTQASIRTRQNGNPTRIPRRSLDNRSAATTPSPPPPPVSASSSSTAHTASRSPKTPAKTPKAVSARKKAPAKKPNKGREETVEEDGEGGGDDLKDAIPVWTQPVGRGNWDEVVLPVVARQKGLNGQYEVADGSPQPRKKEEAIEPAPGTFGYDHTKYRPLRHSNAPLPLDEFGRPNPPPSQPPPTQPLEEEPPSTPRQEIRSAHDNTALPVRSKQPIAVDKPKPMVRPVDPSELGLDLEGRARSEEAGRGKVEKMQVEEPVEESGGCCRCVIM